MVNFVWEMLQMPLFEVGPEVSLIEVNLVCIQASIGDAVMLMIAFWILAVFFKSRRWLFHLSIPRVGLFLVPGITMTILLEALATGPLQRWTYGDLMPILPVIGTGIAPIIQWIIVPPLVLSLVRKQLL